MFRTNFAPRFSVSATLRFSPLSSSVLAITLPRESVPETERREYFAPSYVNLRTSFGTDIKIKMNPGKCRSFPLPALLISPLSSLLPPLKVHGLDLLMKAVIINIKRGSSTLTFSSAFRLSFPRMDFLRIAGVKFLIGFRRTDLFRFSPFACLFCNDRKLHHQHAFRRCRLQIFPLFVPESRKRTEKSTLTDAAAHSSINY